MVRVFSCHHFSRQDVLSMDNEPEALFCADDKLFVATQTSQIQVLDLTSSPNAVLAQFPTLGRVISIVYSKKDGFIATIEENEEDEDCTTAVRVYFCWENAVLGKAVRVNIAGHMTSIRHEALLPEETCLEPSCHTQVKVIEIPLKEEASTFSLNSSTGELAVAMGKHVLLYGLCCKTAASTGKTYQDMKCILDLQFSFRVKYISSCEDFILCASHRQCQVVRLNLSEPRRTSHETEARNHVDPSISRSKNTPLESLISWVDYEDINMNNTKYIVDDVNLVQWDFADDELPNYSRGGTYDRHAYQTTKNIYVASIHGQRDRTSEDIAPTIILGPKQTKKNKMPKVTVEYEDTCGCDDDSRGLIERGTTSYLYSQLALHDSHKYIDPLLIPVYQHRGGEADRGLAGMYCMVSTSREAHLYGLLGDKGSSLLAVYPFTARIKQIYVSGGLLYAMSSTVLEIYTCHCEADTITSTGHTVLQTLEPCMVGLQAFMSLNTMVQSASRLILLSKIQAGSQEDCCWSLYVLHKPTVSDLHQDIVDVSNNYKYTNLPWYEHLLNEDYLLLMSDIYTRGATSNTQQFLQGAALSLALYFSRNKPANVSQCVRYLEESRYSPVYVMEEYLTMQSKNPGVDMQTPAKGLVKFLDQKLLHSSPDESHATTQGVEEMVVSFYKSWSPTRLLYMMLTNRLSHSVPLADILTIPAGADTRMSRLYILTTLAVGAKQGTHTPQTTKALLESFQKDHLEKLLLLIPECLLENGAKFSALGLLLHEYEPALMKHILESLYKQKIVTTPCVNTFIQVQQVVIENGKNILDDGGIAKQSADNEIVSKIFDVLLADSEVNTENGPVVLEKCPRDIDLIQRFQAVTLNTVSR